MGETRRLAAIMAVDVVGYSRLMSEDEAGTAKAVREHRKAAVPIVGSRDDLFKTARQAARGWNIERTSRSGGNGAAGFIFAGANVENAAYPEGWCAETSAISAMAQAGERRIIEILVIGDGEGRCTPCGGCRQRIREFADPGTAIHVAGPDGVRATFTLAELLPQSFGPGHLRTA